jgi:hypothetical protein
MKDKIMLFVIGVLLGAVIATGAFYVYTKATNSCNSNNIEMSGPPEMPNGQNNENGEPPAKPDGENGEPPEKPSDN